MAKNWKAGEAAEAVKSGNVADIIDIGRRFPVFTATVAAATAGDVDSLLKLLNALPEYCTARKLESVLKGDAPDAGDDGDGGGDDGDGEDKPKDKGKEKDKPTKLTKAGLNKMAPKELMAISKEMELDIVGSKKFKEMEGSEKKEALVAAILKAQAKAEEKPKEDDDWGDDEPKGKKEAKKDDDDWDI